VRVAERNSPSVAHGGKGESGGRRTIAKDPFNTVKSNRRLDSLMR